MSKNYITRKLHQLTPNTDVIERNKRGHDKESRQLICITDYSPTEYEEFVFLQPKDFELVFGHKDGDKKHNLPIVKVKNPHNGKYVYRAFRTSQEIKGFNDYAAISYTAIREITDDRQELQSLNIVDISKGSRFGFYWNHPYHATRIAIRLGIVSVVLTIVSMIASIALAIF